MTGDQDQIFETGDELYGSATIGFARDELHLYAYGYRRAAEVLVHHVSTNHTSLDVLVYPVVFLYRHHIELALKLIIRDARILLNELSPQKPGHRLPELWATAKALISRVESCDPVGLDGVDAAIAQIDSVDLRSTVFRYPEDLNGAKSLTAMTNINFFTLRDALEPVFDMLDGIHTMLSTYLEEGAE